MATNLAFRHQAITARSSPDTGAMRPPQQTKHGVSVLQANPGGDKSAPKAVTMCNSTTIRLLKCLLLALLGRMRCKRLARLGHDVPCVKGLCIKQLRRVRCDTRCVGVTSLCETHNTASTNHHLTTHAVNVHWRQLPTSGTGGVAARRGYHKLLLGADRDLQLV